jgi:hypothetical protein
MNILDKFWCLNPLWRLPNRRGGPRGRWSSGDGGAVRSFVVASMGRAGEGGRRGSKSGGAGSRCPKRPRGRGRDGDEFESWVADGMNTDQTAYRYLYFSTYVLPNRGTDFIPFSICVEIFVCPVSLHLLWS